MIAEAYRRKIFFNYEKRMRLRSHPEKVISFQLFMKLRSSYDDLKSLLILDNIPSIFYQNQIMYLLVLWINNVSVEAKKRSRATLMSKYTNWLDTSNVVPTSFIFICFSLFVRFISVYC